MTLSTFLNRSAFDIGAMLLTLTCLVYSLLQRHTDKPQNRIFLMATVAHLATAACNITVSYTAPFAFWRNDAWLLMKIADYLYFILHTSLSFFLFFYAVFATRQIQEIPRIRLFLETLPFLIAEGVVILNPLTGFVYRYTEKREYVRGFGECILYLSAGIYFWETCRLLLYHWRGITTVKRRILVYSATSTCVWLVIQIVLSEVGTELLGEAILLTGIMLAVEYNEDRLDPVTGVNNRIAFLSDLDGFYQGTVPFQVTCVRLVNLDTVMRVLSLQDSDEVIKEVTDHLKSVHPRYMIYRVSDSALALVTMRWDQDKPIDLPEKISQRFLSGFRLAGREMPLSGVVLTAAGGKELPRTEDVLLMCEGALPVRENGRVLKGDDLQYLFYQSSLERALREGMENNAFQVYYQPVYATDGLTLSSAESSIRLTDPMLGELFPVDFVETAERIGIMERLGDYVLEEVCSFLESHVPQRMGISFINVNLSAVQCMRPDFIDHVMGIVRAHQVDPSMINFEITEGVASREYQHLRQVTGELKQKGFLLSMTGYGAGFSNMYSIFSLDFDIVKMDKSLLSETDRSENGWIILENSIRMIHELDRKVIVVGVETREQIERVRDLYVDWIQGYYFSKPLTRKELSALAS